MAPNKAVTNAVLRSVGLPVPRQFAATGPGEAVAAAKRLGYPVVLKPVKGGKGRQVHVGLRNEAELRQAFERGPQAGEPVAVEAFIHGEEQRLPVVCGKLFAAARRHPATVLGGGRPIVRVLAAQVGRAECWESGGK